MNFDALGCYTAERWLSRFSTSCPRFDSRCSYLLRGQRQSTEPSPGTLAACCKPSSGAGAVWMEYTLERPSSNLGHEEWRPPQGDPTKEQLYQGADQAGKRTQD